MTTSYFSVSPLQALLDAHLLHYGAELLKPEYRQVEMYTAPDVRPMIARLAPQEMTVQHLGRLLPHINGPWMTLHLLESAMILNGHISMSGQQSWANYLAIPRRTRAEKVIAESYRLLRIIRIALLHPLGFVKGNEKVIELTCHSNAYPVMVKITPCGLRLLQSLVNFYLNEYRLERIGPGYLDEMLVAYFSDLVEELYGFEDEDHVLCQFRSLTDFNRHYRFDCLNPRYFYTKTHCVIELSPQYSEQSFPIDFHICQNEHSYLIPMEALTLMPVDNSHQFGIAREELVNWLLNPENVEKNLRKLTVNL